jgi:hypothetical protein
MILMKVESDAHIPGAVEPLGHSVELFGRYDERILKKITSAPAPYRENQERCWGREQRCGLRFAHSTRETRTPHRWIT